MYLYQNTNRLILTIIAIAICAIVAIFAWREHRRIGVVQTPAENAAYIAAAKEQAAKLEPGVLPALSKEQIDLHSSETMVDGITLYQALEITGVQYGDILSIRSLGPLYPDGTCIRFELLVRDGKSLLRKTVDKAGVVIVGRAVSSLEPKTSFSRYVPNSPDALRELVANPYFAKARTSGLAIYWDAQSADWKYVIQTDLGNVSIVIPT